jgi:hypothetical protein
LEWHSEDDIDYYSDDSGKVLPRMIVRQYLTAPEQLFIRLIEPSVPEEDYYYALSTNNNNENNQQQQQQQQPSKSGSLEVEKLICSCPRLCEPLTTDAASATNQVYPEQVTPWPRDLLALHESMISTPAANLHQTNSRKRHRRHRSRSNYYGHSKTYDITEVPLPMPLSGRASLRDLPIIPEQTEVRYDYDIVLQLRPDMIPKDGMGGGEESLRVTFRRPRQFLPSLSSARWHNHVSYDYGSKRDLYYDPEYEFDAEYNSEDVNANHHIDDDNNNNNNVEEVVTVDLRRFANPFDLDWMGLVEKTLDDWKKQGQINQENARRLLLELEDAASDSSASSTNPFRPRSLVDRLSTASKDYTNWGFGSSNSRSSSSNSNN